MSKIKDYYYYYYNFIFSFSVLIIISPPLPYFDSNLKKNYVS